jgi:hypothetical protein
MKYRIRVITLLAALSAIFGFASAAPVPLHLLNNPAEDRAVEAIQKLGGIVTRDEKKLGKPVVEVWIEKVTDADLKVFAPLKGLTKLDLHHALVTDAGLKELSQLTYLTTLNLGGTKITDAGLKELAPFKGLTVLVLSRTEVTDAGLKELAQFKKLDLLMLITTKVTDAGVADFQKALPKCNTSYVPR